MADTWGKRNRYYSFLQDKKNIGRTLKCVMIYKIEDQIQKLVQVGICFKIQVFSFIKTGNIGHVVFQSSSAFSVDLLRLN